MTDPSTDGDESIDIYRYLDILLRRRWILLAAVAISTTLSTLYTMTRQPVYQAATLLLIEKERGGTTVFSNGTQVESNNDDYYQTQYRLLQSESILQRVYDSLDLGRTEEFAGGVDRLRNALTIAPIARSRLVLVKADSSSPERAAEVANSLSSTYVDQNLGYQLFISKEILEALKAKGDSREARRVFEALPAVVNNGLIQNLKSERAKLETQAADLALRYTDKHPALRSLRSSMGALESQIDAETDRIVQSLKTELSGQLKGNNVRIVDPAKAPRTPIRPWKGMTILLGLLTGLLLGVMLSLAVDALDQTVRTQEDVEVKLRIPYLSTIPYLAIPSSDRAYGSLLSAQQSLTGEAFRNLRTMVDFANVKERSPFLVVTSAMQEEGKTYVATNLAVAFSQIGERVLLIDGDLRRPKLHKNFRISNERGLSDFLVSGDSVEEIESLLRPSDIPRLTLLTCGTRPPNPSELLNTPRLGALLAWARNRFDRVLVDTTPMFPINDTLLWGRHIRPCVFVVRYGKTHAPLIRSAFQKLMAGGMDILGTALNAAKTGGLTYSPYSYYYQHKYYEDRPEKKADVAA